MLPEQVHDCSKIEWAQNLHRGHSITVNTERLDSILNRSGIKPGFDLLVVDVEGAEEKVMKGFDIQKWKPLAILIELEDEHPDFFGQHPRYGIRRAPFAR